MVVAFHRHTLPLNNCLYALQPSILYLTRSTLHRCLERHGTFRLSDVIIWRCRSHGATSARVGIWEVGSSSAKQVGQFVEQLESV